LANLQENSTFYQEETFLRLANQVVLSKSKFFPKKQLRRNTSKNQKYGKMTPIVSEWLDFFSG
jgi:hypothetical protein